ncbi:MAG: DMT family transporter [Spirochaetales bacterium]|nr:MAG: DMT family transporter [Spirochaetales bacterium]
MSQSSSSGPVASEFKYDLLLLLAAAIWGTGFVAQRLGLRVLPPIAFNGARFGLGALALIPFILLRRTTFQALRKAAGPAVLAGFVIAIAANLQQIGMQSTGAGKAGFITGLYVVLVPITAIFLGKRTSVRTWLGAGLALIGLFLLSVTGNFTMERGDFIIFVSAFFWTAHILVLDHWAHRVDVIALTAMQFAVCSVVSWAIAFPVETFAARDFITGIGPVLYGGLVSIGIGFTLQTIGQTKAHPARASIILSMEATFAVLAGWLILGEILSVREISGCALMFAGIILAQLPGRMVAPPSTGLSATD